MRELSIFKSDGVEQARGASLAAGTYYAEFRPADAEESRVSAMQWVWDATAAVTVTIEDSCIPSISTYAAAASGWDPVTGAAVPTIAGGSASNSVKTYVVYGSGRRRTKLVVTVAGVVQVYENHKPR
jgi:hypothetical protein